MSEPYRRREMFEVTSPAMDTIGSGQSMKQGANAQGAYSHVKGSPPSLPHPLPLSFASFFLSRPGSFFFPPSTCLFPAPAAPFAPPLSL